MRILLDENLDPLLKERIISEYVTLQTYTVKDMNWLGLKNDELLKKALNENFKVFVSGDQNLEHKQNLSVLDINIIVLKLTRNTFSDQIMKLLDLNFTLEKIHRESNTSSYFEI